MPSRFVSCPLCGQGFGSASIAIHVPQCYDKALKRWQLDPRGPKPVMPVRSSPGLGSTKGLMASRLGAGSSMSDGPSPQPLRVPLSQQQQELFAAPAPGAAAINRHPCKKCGRSFAFDRIQYHESVCIGPKKRKQFNAKKQRLSEFDEYELRAAAAASGSKPMGRGSRAVLAAGRPSGAHSWRQQHQEFIDAIRTAKRYTAAASSVSNTAGGAPRSQVALTNPTSQRRPPRQPFGVNALRNPQTFRTAANRSAQSQEAGAGAGARARQQEMQFLAPQPASAQRPAVRAQQSVSRGGSGLGGAPRGGAWTGASPSYRIVHTNATSQAMLEAFGRV